MENEKKRILKMIENGTVTAEEAVTLLEALDETPKPNNTDVSTYVDWDSTEGKTKETAYSSKVKWTDFIENAIQKLKDVDFDLNFGNAFHVHHIFFQQNPYFSTIHIEIANGELKLSPWKEQDVRVECEAKVYKVDHQEDARNVFLQQVDFNVADGVLQFKCEKKAIKISTVLYVPVGIYDELKVKMFNGSVSGKDILVNKAKLKTANGNVTFDGLKADEKVELEIGNGSITIEKGMSSLIEAETLNGPIKVEGVFEKADLQSVNGNVMYHIHDERTHTALMKTTTGSIDVSVPDYVSIDGVLKTNFGNFSSLLQNEKIREEKKDIIQKMKRFTAGPEMEKRLHLEADTKTGSISVKVK